MCISLTFSEQRGTLFIPEWTSPTISGYIVLKTLQSHRQNTRNTTLFIAPLADVMHCQVLGGQRGGAAAAAAATLYKGATKEPGPRRRRRRTRWRQNSPARRRTWRRRRPPPSTFAYGLYPKQQLDAGHRLRRMCAVVLHQIPIFSCISNFVKQCGEQVNDGK